MAINTKEQLKALLAKGILSNKLIDNIIDSYTDITFTPDHNDLEDIQGGTAGEYNHLTDVELSNIGVWVNEGVDKVLYSGATELERVTPEGNRSFDGATIPAVGVAAGEISEAFIHLFYPNTTVMHTNGTVGTAERVYTITNGYRDSGGAFLSLSDSDYCTYLLMDSVTPRLESRQSTLVSAAVGQTMLMTTLLPLS